VTSLGHSDSRSTPTYLHDDLIPAAPLLLGAFTPQASMPFKPRHRLLTFP
jgi:hypothetical protein